MQVFNDLDFSMDEAYDPRLTHTLEEGVAIARALGVDIAKVSMDLRRFMRESINPGLWLIAYNRRPVVSDIRQTTLPP